MVTAGDIMTTEVITVMTQKKIYTIPVMDGNRMVGIIGKADLIRTIAG